MRVRRNGYCQSKCICTCKCHHKTRGFVELIQSNTIFKQSSVLFSIPQTTWMAQFFDLCGLLALQSNLARSRLLVVSLSSRTHFTSLCPYVSISLKLQLSQLCSSRAPHQALHISSPNPLAVSIVSPYFLWILFGFNRLFLLPATYLSSALGILRRVSHTTPKEMPRHFPV